MESTLGNTSNYYTHVSKNCEFVLNTQNSDVAPNFQLLTNTKISFGGFIPDITLNTQKIQANVFDLVCFLNSFNTGIDFIYINDKLIVLRSNKYDLSGLDYVSWENDNGRTNVTQQTVAIPYLQNIDLKLKSLNKSFEASNSTETPTNNLDTFLTANSDLHTIAGTSNILKYKSINYTFLLM